MRTDFLYPYRFSENLNLKGKKKTQESCSEEASKASKKLAFYLYLKNTQK